MSNTVLPGIISTGEVFGPASSTSGNLPSFADTSGTLLADSGKSAASVVLGPASATSGNIASYNGATGKVIADGGKAIADVVTGPASAVSGNVASYNGATGKIVADSGKLAADLVTGPASAVSGNLASFNGVTGKIVADSAIVAANVALKDVFEELVPTEGGTVTIGDSTTVAIIHPASALTAATINMPAAPTNRQIVRITEVGDAIVGVTMDGNGNTLLGGLTALAVSAFGSWIFQSSNTTWYRIG